jgi:DNA-binding IclR family transcriptional regulator
MSASKKEGPMVLPRAFSLLRHLAQTPGGLTLSDISNRLDAPKSSLSSTLKALTEQQFLKREGAQYFLGPEAFSLASVILAGRSIRRIARPYLERAMEQCGETVLLAALDDDQRHATYIDVIESPKSVRFTVSIGTRRPLYANACGRLFLAHQSETVRRAYFSSTELTPITDKSIVERSKLEDVLGDIRNTGISQTLGDYSPDSAGFAAPIFNSDGTMVAALTIGVPISRGLREEKRFIQIAGNTAREISKILGYSD